MQSNGSYEISYIPHQAADHSKKLFYVLESDMRKKVVCGTLIHSRTHFTALCTHRIHGEIFMTKKPFLPHFSRISLAIFTTHTHTRGKWI